MSRTPPAANCSASFSVETVQGPLAVGMSNRAISMLFAVFRCGRNPTLSACKRCLSLEILRSIRCLSSSKHGVANASIPSLDLLTLTPETKMNRPCSALDPYQYAAAIQGSIVQSIFRVVRVELNSPLLGESCAFLRLSCIFKPERHLLRLQSIQLRFTLHEDSFLVLDCMFSHQRIDNLRVGPRTHSGHARQGFRPGLGRQNDARLGSANCARRQIARDGRDPI